MRRAPFGPMPGTFVKALSSPVATARSTSAAVCTLSTARAMRGPMPETESIMSKTSRSAGSEKP